MENIIKGLTRLLFPRENNTHLNTRKEKRVKMTLLHVMAMNNVDKGSIRPLQYGVLRLKRGVQGYGESLFRAKYWPGSLFSLKNAQILCLEEAKTRHHFDILFMDNAPWDDKVMVRCPRCNDFWPWQERLQNDLWQEPGRMCQECQKEVSSSNGVFHTCGQRKRLLFN